MRVRFLLPVLALAACSERPRSGVPAPEPAAAAERPCADVADYRACADSVEREVLTRAGPGAERRGDTLLIRPTHGPEVRMVTDTSDADRWVIHHYQAFLPDVGQHLVSAHFYEGGEYLVVDHATGRRVAVPTRPVVSPGGERFAVASLDHEAGYGPNLIAIWRFAPGGPVLEWGLEGGTAWGATDPVWVSDDELHFTRVHAETSFEDGRETRMRVRVGEDGITVSPLNEGTR